MSENISTKEITKFTRHAKVWGAKYFFFLLGKRARGQILTNDTQRHSPGTPQKSGESVTLRHFHERVGESPRRENFFGTSKYKIRRFVSKIWPFEVGICVRADQLGTDIQGAKQQCAGDRTWVLWAGSRSL